LPEGFVDLPSPPSGKGGIEPQPVSPINYGGSYTYEAPAPLTQQYRSMAMPPAAAADNTGMVVDPTLLAAQEILARPRNIAAPVPVLGSGILQDYAQGYEPLYYAAAPSAQFVPPVAANVSGGAEGASDMPGSSAPVGGQGTSGLVDASGNFVGDLGQGISSTQQNIGLGLMNYGQTLNGFLPGGSVANAVGQAMVDSQIDAINESLGLLGTIGQQPGMVSVSDAQGNVASMVTPESLAVSDYMEFGVAPGLSIGGNFADATGIDVGQAAEGDPEGAQAVASQSVGLDAFGGEGPSIGGGGGGDGPGIGGTGVGVDSAGVSAGNEGAGLGAAESAAGGDGGGGGGGGGCVIATHAVNSGAFTPREKKRAVVWCTRNLHNKWWGETIRRGYRYHGNKAIEAGRAHQYYDEFRDFIKFATGIKRTPKTARIFAWRCVQFFVTGLLVKGY
jgi:hypothetical protein